MTEDSQIFIFIPEPHIPLGTTDPGIQVTFLPLTFGNHWKKEMSDELTSSNSDSRFISFSTSKISKTMNCFSKKWDMGKREKHIENRVTNKVTQRHKGREQGAFPILLRTGSPMLCQG